MSGSKPPSDLPSDERPHPNLALVHRELRRPGAILMLLREEDCDSNSHSFSCSWFCEQHREWAGRLKPTLRQVHVAGEKLFVDYGGRARQTVSDNLKAGITPACFHEPMINRTCADLARHYRTAIVPAQPYRPRDEAKVEVGLPRAAGIALFWLSSACPSQR